MSLVYTTSEEAIAYLTALPQGEQFETLTDAELERAQDDVDRQNLRCPGVDYDADNGLKIDIDDLTDRQYRLLSQAVADQAKYRRYMGEEQMALEEYESVAMGSMSRTGKLPKFSRDAYDKLCDADLLAHWGSQYSNLEREQGTWEPWGGRWGGF